MRQPGADIALDEPFLNGPRRFVTSFEKTFWGEKGARDENHGEAQGPRSKTRFTKSVTCKTFQWVNALLSLL